MVRVVSWFVQTESTRILLELTLKFRLLRSYIGGELDHTSRYDPIDTANCFQDFSTSKFDFSTSKFHLEERQ